MVNQIKGPLTLDEYISYREDGLIPQNKIDYQCEYSGMWNGTDARLSYTPAQVSDDDHMWFYSAFVEITALGTARILYSSWDGFNGGIETIRLQPDDTLNVQIAERGTILNWDYYTSRKFLATGFYHIYVRVDTTQPDPEDRVQLFVNGSRVYFSVAVAVPLNTVVMTGGSFGHSVYGSTTNDQFFNGFGAETVLGIGVTPPNGVDDFYVWDFNDMKPKEYQGPIGTTGSYLKFDDNTDLGKAHRGADWTVVGTPVQSKNTPTNQLCKLNHNDYGTVSSNGTALSTSGASKGTRGTVYVSEGRYSWMVRTVTHNYTSSIYAIGVSNLTDENTKYSYSYYGDGGAIYLPSEASVAYGDAYTHAAEVEVMLDCDNSKIQYVLDGAAQGWYDLPEGGVWTPHLSDGTGSGAYSASYTVDFTQETYVPYDSTFLPLPSQVSVRPGSFDSLSKHFVDGIIDGTGVEQSVTLKDALGNPVTWDVEDDCLLIAKNTGDTTSSTDSWLWSNTLRGLDTYMSTDTSAVETTDTDTIVGYDGSSLTVGVSPLVNRNTDSIYYALLRAGKAKVNNEGTIQSTVSVNHESGFAIVTTTANNGVTGTIGHDLRRKVGAIIGKSVGPVERTWMVYFSCIGATKYSLFSSAAATLSTSVWGGAEPTNSVFTIGADANLNSGTEEVVYYVFAEDSPFIKCIPALCNGDADGPLVNVDMTPRFVLQKNTDTINPANLFSQALSETNIVKEGLHPAFSNSIDKSTWASGAMSLNGTSTKTLMADLGVNNSGVMANIIIGQPTALRRAN